MKRDENDVKKVVDIVQNMVDPFQVSEELTSISTGIKPSKVTEVPWALATPNGTLFKATKALLLDDLEKDIPAVVRAPP